MNFDSSLYPYMIWHGQVDPHKACGLWQKDGSQISAILQIPSPVT